MATSSILTTVRQKYQSLAPLLHEKARRRWAACEALALGRGGISLVATATGLGCFQILKCRLPGCDGTTPARFQSWYRGLLWEMQAERTDPRRNRINPRVIKRKMSKWKKKRPQHRHLPPVRKTFPEAVVMLR